LLKLLLKRANRSALDFDWSVSPLSRTRETMDNVRARVGEPLPSVTIDPRLIEISFGIYEGHLHTELASGAMAIAGERDASFWYFRPPEGESYDDVATRVLDFGRSLTGPAIVVSHGGILRVLRHLIEGFPHERAVNWFPPQDSVVHFTDGKSVVYPAGQSWDD
jgi:probable phosphoglycerate mutase